MNILCNKQALFFTASVLSVLSMFTVSKADAAIALDRTRIIFSGAHSSESVSVTNQNKSLPYLAQAWLEDAEGHKLMSPLKVLPPIQRVEPGEKGQIKIQAMNAATSLPQDRESVFYFNLREIPPKSTKANTLQIALQTRIKLFYRPEALMAKASEIDDVYKQVTITRKNGSVVINNPTPFYMTIINAATGKNAAGIDGFKPVMLEPISHASLKVRDNSLGEHPILTVINDFGGTPKLMFDCNSHQCHVANIKAG